METAVAVIQVVAESKKAERFDLAKLLDLIHAKLPADKATDLITFIKRLWARTESIAGHVVAIGKIILSKIYAFVVDNPNLVLGIAIGAALGALSVTIPLVGNYIAPLTSSLGAIVGGVVGHQLDMIAQGRDHFNGTMDAALASVIDIAKEFFKMIIEIFRSVSEYLKDVRPLSA